MRDLQIPLPGINRSVAVRKRHQQQDEIRIFFYPHYTGICKFVFLSALNAHIYKNRMLYETCAYAVQTGLRLESRMYIDDRTFSNNFF